MARERRTYIPYVKQDSEFLGILILSMLLIQVKKVSFLFNPISKKIDFVIYYHINFFSFLGNYGRGVYFSEYPSYSMTYIRGASTLLLCQVLPGKVFRCTNLIHGEPLESGHDSHTSPDGKELVIFNSYHILPSYVVHYGDAKGDFLYEKATTKSVSC